MEPGSNPSLLKVFSVSIPALLHWRYIKRIITKNICLQTVIGAHAHDVFERTEEKSNPQVCAVPIVWGTFVAEKVSNAISILHICGTGCLLRSTDFNDHLHVVRHHLGSIRHPTLWNFRVMNWTPQRHQFWCVKAERSGDQIISATWVNTFEVVVWSLRTVKILKVLNVHKGPLSTIQFRPLFGTLSSASWDRSVHLWDIYERKCNCDVLAITRSPLRGVCPDK